MGEDQGTPTNSQDQDSKCGAIWDPPAPVKHSQLTQPEIEMSST